MIGPYEKPQDLVPEKKVDTRYSAILRLTVSISMLLSIINEGVEYAKNNRRKSSPT